MTLPVKPQRGQTIRADIIGQIIDYLREITPIQGPNSRVSRTPGGSVISGQPGGGDGAAADTAPWTVRKHVTDGDPTGQWEIWLPDGCMSVGGDCAPLNPAASAKEGHSGDRSGWYALDLTESAGVFSVVAHAKTSAKVSGVDELSAPARRMLYVSAGDETDAVWGDEFSQTVATVQIASSGEEMTRKITQVRTTPISVSGRAPSNFDLVWYFGFDAGSALKVDKVYCLRQLLAVAGMGVTGDTLTEVTDAGSVYARIDTSNMSDGDGIITVEADPEGTTTSGDFVTWLPLYDLTNNAVTADYRNQSLVNVQLYRA